MYANKKFDYTNVTPSKVFEKSVNAMYVQRYKAEQMSMEEIKQQAYCELRDVYIALFADASNYYVSQGLVLTKGMIADRNLIELSLQCLSEKDVNAYKCFSYLKQLGAISVCGAGYIFEDGWF